MKNKRKLLLTISWLAVTVLFFFCFRHMEWARVWKEIGSLNSSWVALAITINLSVLGFWALQWQVFLPEDYSVSFSRMTEVVALISMTLNTVPFFAGHLLGVVLLWKREQISSAAAVSVMSLDQLSRGLAKVLLFLLLAFFTPTPGWMKNGILLVTIAVLSLFALFYAFARRYRDKPLHGEKVAGSVISRVTDFVGRWARYMEALRSARHFCLGLVLAVAMKGAEATAIWSVQKAFGISLPLWSVLLVLAALSLVTMVPVSPGNLGIYEAVVFFIYQYMGVPPEQALGISLVQHVCYLFPLVGAGYVYIIIKYLSPRKQANLSPSA